MSDGPTPRSEDGTPGQPPSPSAVGRPVHVRRAPRYRAFVLTGLAAAVAVAAVIALLTPASGGYSRLALLGYLGVTLGLVGGVLGGLVAVLVDRRADRRR
ncbi:hypothetical protein CLV92_10218 [Kineococcus xinjiangensis]|uniref:Uncharacterized protein n=1 Tax=Kineococcus xinjiangensis TaxID=512762 RepID=A0A2S6IUI8_9ACTN|nr:hypothetical protein [Kineococcus xinjiangensis]PPK97868.1 hypothetical protein CLV92_10218 [Kineococcus xinjiangensis]